jgi:hypothetical protein
VAVNVRGRSPKTARFIGSQNLTKLNIADAIDKAKAKRSERSELTADWVIDELRKLAGSNRALAEPYSVASGLLGQLESGPLGRRRHAVGRLVRVLRLRWVVRHLADALRHFDLDPEAQVADRGRTAENVRRDAPHIRRELIDLAKRYDRRVAIIPIAGRRTISLGRPLSGQTTVPLTAV